MRSISKAGVGFLLVLAACERLPTGPPDSGDHAFRGIVFADWSAGGYADPVAAGELGAVAETGAGIVALLVTAYQDDARSVAVNGGHPATPTPAAVDAAVTAAEAVGLDLALKLHVDLEDGSWRGTIDPPDPEAWFASYREFVLPWADFAESRGLSLFMVGTELAGTIRHEARWRELIRETRDHFSGTVVYAASWDEAAKVPFWDAVDQVGVDFYFPVARRREPGRTEILAEWQPWLDRLHRLHAQTGQRILFTEIGYRSVDGAGMHPYTFDDTAVIDLEEQADLYWAALEAAAGEDWVAGLFWWNWLADGSGGPANADYTPRGKPAERELASAWGGP